MAMTDPGEEREAVEALLPWYATGRLDASDKTRVEKALSRWPELRVSLRLVEEDRDETIALNDGLGVPGGDAWARVAAAMSAEPRQPALKSRIASLAAFFGLGPEPNRTRLAWIGAAAAMVIGLQGAAIVGLSLSRNGAVYRTATAHSTVGAEVLIAFAPDARIDQISAFLQARHASIDEGPRSGMYRVRFGDGPLSHEEAEALIKDLRASPIVRMALPGGGD
jgi:hypothetical protein